MVKKSKESRYENDRIEEVVDGENDENVKKDNDEVINESDYFFVKVPDQIIKNTLLFLVGAILFFFWENDKLPESIFTNECSKRCSFIFCGNKNLANSDYERSTVDSFWIFSGYNWFGLATLGSLIVITMLVELILNHLLTGYISYFLDKDENKNYLHIFKKYLHILKMSLKKRVQFFSNLSLIKILFIILCYLICGFVIALFARFVKRCSSCYYFHNFERRVWIDGWK